MSIKKQSNILLTNLGLRIRKIRQEKGISQASLSFSCDMEKSNVSRIESGKTNPTYLILYRISKALGLSLSELFNDDFLKLEYLCAWYFRPWWWAKNKCLPHKYYYCNSPCTHVFCCCISCRLIIFISITLLPWRSFLVFIS